MRTRKCWEGMPHLRCTTLRLVTDMRDTRSNKDVPWREESSWVGLGGVRVGLGWPPSRALLEAICAFESVTVEAGAGWGPRSNNNGTAVKARGRGEGAGPSPRPAIRCVVDRGECSVVCQHRTMLSEIVTPSSP